MLYIFLYSILSYFYFQSVSQKKVYGTKFLFIVFLFTALMVGLGDMLGGYDRYIYTDLFDGNADLIQARGIFWNEDSAIMGYKSEAAYVIWNCLVAYITANRYIFILITTLFIYSLLFISFKRYMENYPLAVLIFMGLWVFFTFTYLRQVMATSCAWLAYKYVIDRKLWKFLIISFVAYKFHNSAIIFFPLYFLPHKKWSPEVIIIVLVIFLIIGASGVTMSLFDVYAGANDITSHEGQRAAAYADDSKEFRWDYVFEVIIFLYFIFKRYEEIPNNRKNLVFLNASLMFCAILLLFIQSSNAGRQSWYYMFGIIYTLTYLSSRRRIIDNYAKSIFLIMSVLFIRIVFEWGILLSPYKTFLTNGHREGDVIHYKFEYDENYDQDKMYRDPWVLW